MTVIELLQQHRSIRKFTAQPIKDALLTELIRAGQSAATSSFIQATTVIRVTDADKRRQFAELSGGQAYVQSAPEFLVFCADLNRNKQRSQQADYEPDFAWTEQFIAATVDVALFAQNVVIAAQSSGLGICYIGGIRNNPDQVCELLNLPDLVFPVFGLCLGYPDQQPEQKPRLPLDALLGQNEYPDTGISAEKIDQYDQQVRRYYEQRTSGKLKHSWSEQMKTQSETQSRPFILRFLNDKGFIIK